MNWKETDWKWNYYQGLIQKEKVHINCEKGAQISFLTNKIATQWPNIIRKESKQTFIYHLLVIMFTLCCWFGQNTRIVFNGSFSIT